MRTKDWRRAQAERYKGKARRYYQVQARWLRSHEGFADNPRLVGLRAATRKPCSGYCCGNPRRHFGHPTMQERRLSQD